MIHRNPYCRFIFLTALLLHGMAWAAAIQIPKALNDRSEFKPSVYADFGQQKVGAVIAKNTWNPEKYPKGYALGFAEFAAHDYKLSSPMIYALNFGLNNLVQAHSQVFQRKVSPSFRVRFRIFNTFDGYAKYSKDNYNKEVTKNLLGFFSPGRYLEFRDGTRRYTKLPEIITWKQQAHLTWRLVPTLLHEGCHAIMNEMYGELPFWMVEGSADWFGEAPSWLQKADGLRHDQYARWIRLDDMRKNGQLPPLETYLRSHSYGQWARMFNDNIGMGYDIGWSVFDFFMKSHNQSLLFLGRISNDAVARAGKNPQPGQLEGAFVDGVKRHWPKGQLNNGLQMLERGWHSWIQIRADQAKKLIREERAKQKTR